MPNAKDFYKGIFLHVIPVRIIVPWSDVSPVRQPKKYKTGLVIRAAAARLSICLIISSSCQDHRLP